MPSDLLLGFDIKNALVFPCEIDIFREPEVINVASCPAGATFKGKVVMEELFLGRFSMSLTCILRA
jgi:hypothetical protein